MSVSVSVSVSAGMSQGDAFGINRRDAKTRRSRRGGGFLSESLAPSTRGDK